MTLLLGGPGLSTLSDRLDSARPTTAVVWGRALYLTGIHVQVEMRVCIARLVR